jgi:hypothetical protein
MSEHTRPSDTTRAEEAKEAQQEADPGRGPTAEEEAAADSWTPDPDGAAAEKEQYERGAHAKGEGQLP